MFDLSWSELLLVGAVALVVIGPRELPRVLRTAGQALSKLRRMAGEFQSQFSAAIREAELDEIRSAVSDFQATADRTIGGSTKAAFDPLRSVRDELREAIQKPAASNPVDSKPATDSLAAESSIAGSPAASVPPPASAPLPRHEASQPLWDRVGRGGALADPVPAPAVKRQRSRVVVAAPREAVKPLARPARGTSRLYKKVRFSALPARPRPTPGGKGKA